jgi:DNA-binding CsgD family transcriptional regulator
MMEKYPAYIIPLYEDRLHSRTTRLSPTETQVAILVRQGCKTKEIAVLMNMAAKTVDLHRYNIRCKLGLGRKGLNLQTFLKSLPEAMILCP